MSLSAAAFAAVRRALDGAVDDVDAATHAKAAPEDQALLALAPGDEELGTACYRAVRRNYTRDVRRCQRLRRRRRTPVSTPDVHSLIRRGAADAKRLSALADARLSRQLEAAERRLQELAHECVGEHAKARSRLAARAEKTAARRFAERAAAKSNARWALFLLRCEGDAPLPREEEGMRRKPPLQLRACVERDAVKRGALACRDACTKPGHVRVQAALALRHKRGSVDDARDARALETFRATKVVFCRGAAAWTARPALQATIGGFPHAETGAKLVDLLVPSRPRTPAARFAVDAGELLSAGPAAWLCVGNPSIAFDDTLPSDADPDPATHALCSGRIYYQLDGAHVPEEPVTGDDVSGSLVSDGASLKRAWEVHDALQSAHPFLAADGASEVSEVACTRDDHVQKFGGVAGSDELADAVAGQPRVLVDRTGKRFAAGSVAQLLEARHLVLNDDVMKATALVAARRSARAPRWGARDLYVCCTTRAPCNVQDAKETPKECLRRLAPACVAELARAYLLDTESEVTALDVFPAEAQNEICSLVPDAAGAKGDAFLVSWTVEDEEPGRAASARVAPMVEEEENDDILGPVCQWRSCSCAAKMRRDPAKKSPPRPLCAWHHALKRHLDDGAQAAGRASDALRFVPRAKAAREAQEAVRASKKSTYGDQDAAEAAAIRGASPLLVELANGKLGQTVRVFCRRAAAESAERRARKTGDRPGVGWARWDDARALSSARRDVAASLDRLDRVCVAERAATSELAARRAAGQFPADALVAIKREHARLDAERAQGEADAAADERLELEFARRKVALLKSDRGENAQQPGAAAAAADILAATAGRGDRSPEEQYLASPIREEPGAEEPYAAPRRRAMRSTVQRAAAKIKLVSPYVSNQPPARPRGRRF